MRTRTATRPGRAVVVALPLLAVVAGVGLAVLVAPVLAVAPSTVRTGSLPGAVAAGGAVALVGCWAYLVAVVGLACRDLLAEGPHAEVSPRPSAVRPSAVRPAWARRVAAVVLGVGLGLPAATAASAATAATAAPPVPAAPAGELPLPVRPTGGLTADPAPRQVVVRPGDSLWSISERLLPPRAGDAAVDAAWRRLHAANRARLGPDPDLIHPGTRLTVPRPEDPA